MRGLGVLDIRAMFGDNTVKATKYLRLIVRLKTLQTQQTGDRLATQQDTQMVLGTAIPCVTLWVAPGRNLAILVEAAVRSHLLKQKGLDATQHFIANQQAALRPEVD